MSVNDSESRRSELNISLSVSQADLGPTYCHELFFSFFFSKFGFFKLTFVLTANGTEIFWRVSLNSIFFFGSIALPLASASELHPRFGNEILASRVENVY